MYSAFVVWMGFLLISILAVPVNAQPYVGFSYMSMGYEEADVERARLPSGTTFEFESARNGPGIPTEFDSVFDLDERLEGVNIKYGYVLSRFLAIEARAGLGVSKITLDDFTERLIGRTQANPDLTKPPILKLESLPRDSELTLKHYYGVYARVGMMREWQVAPYVLFGLSRGFFDITETEVNGKGGGHLEDESLGVGVNVKLNDVLNVNVEYVELFDRGDIEISNWNIGLEYHM